MKPTHAHVIDKTDPIWEGIAEHGAHFRASVSRGRNRSPERKTFPRTTPPQEMQNWRKRTAAKLLLTKEARATQGAFSKDVKTYLALEAVIDQPTFDQKQQHLDFWVSKFGHRHRDTITKNEVEDIYRRLLKDPRSETDARPLTASTANKYLRTLRNLFTRLDGNSKNIVSGVKEEDETEPEGIRRSISYATIATIIDAMADQGRAAKGGQRPALSLTKIRVRCMAYCQITSKPLKALKPEHIDWAGSRVFLIKRKKGGGHKAIWTPVTQMAMEAFADFHAANLYGKGFSNASALKSFRAAARKVAPDLVKPRIYDLRHSVATQIVRLTKNPKVASHLLQHGDERTTKRYWRDLIPEEATDAVGLMDDYLKQLPTGPVQ